MNTEQLKRSKDVIVKTLKNDYTIIDTQRKAISAKDFKMITDDEKKYMVQSGSLLLQLRFAIKNLEGVEL